MNQCVSLPGLKPQISSFHRRKIPLLPSRPRFQVHKACFPELSKLWKETLGHIVPFHDKKSSGEDFLECWLYISCFWLSESILSDVFPARSGRSLFLSEAQMLEQSCGCNRKEMNQNLFKTNTVLVRGFECFLKQLPCIFIGMDSIWHFAFT